MHGSCAPLSEPNSLTAREPLSSRRPAAAQVSFTELPRFSFDLTLFGGDVSLLPGLETCEHWAGRACSASWVRGSSRFRLCWSVAACSLLVDWRILCALSETSCTACSAGLHGLIKDSVLRPLVLPEK